MIVLIIDKGTTVQLQGTPISTPVTAYATFLHTSKTNL